MTAILAFWTIAGWAFVAPDVRRLLYVWFAGLPLMSFAVLPVAVTGGLTLTPAPVIAALIVLRIALRRRGIEGMLAAALAPRRLLLLTVYWMVAVIVTAFMPRILAGRVTVVPVREAWLGPSPLAPSMQNASQLIYLTISVLFVIALAEGLRDPRVRQAALQALVLGGLVTVVTGTLDWASAKLPLEWLLAPFRTASYALLVSDRLMHAKRIVGLTPEASSFGLVCLSLLTMLWFFRRGLEARWVRDGVVPPLLLALAAFVWLSTSSAAYVGLAVLGLAVLGEWGTGRLGEADRRTCGRGSGAPWGLRRRSSWWCSFCRTPPSMRRRSSTGSCCGRRRPLPSKSGACGRRFPGTRSWAPGGSGLAWARPGRRMPS